MFTRLFDLSLEFWAFSNTLIFLETKNSLKKNIRIHFLVLSIVFFIGAIVAFYHFGIEQGYFNESAVCTLKSVSETISKKEILEQLQLKTVSCKDVTFRVFGFSLTTFNMLLSLILVILLINLFKNYEKYQK